MNECENCGESVDSRWKFCLSCGAIMPAELSRFAVSAGGFSGATATDSARIDFSQPAAAHREDDLLGEYTPAAHVGKRRFRFDWQLWLGITLALGGVALIVYLVSVFIIPHG